MRNGLRQTILILTTAAVLSGCATPERKEITQKALEEAIKNGVCAPESELPLTIYTDKSETVNGREIRVSRFWHEPFGGWFQLNNFGSDEGDFQMDYHEMSHYCGISIEADLTDLASETGKIKLLRSKGFRLEYETEGIKYENSTLEEARAYYAMSLINPNFFTEKTWNYEDLSIAKYMEIMIREFNLIVFQVSFKDFLEQIFLREPTAEEVLIIVNSFSDIHSGKSNITSEMKKLFDLTGRVPSYQIYP